MDNQQNEICEQMINSHSSNYENQLEMQNQQDFQLLNRHYSNREQQYLSNQECHSNYSFLSTSTTNNTNNQQCPPISLNLGNNFYQNLEQMMFSDDNNDSTASSLNMLGSNNSLLNLKKEGNFIQLRKQTSLKLDRRQSSSYNYDASQLLFRKIGSDDSASTQTTNAKSSGLIQNVSSFTTAVSNPFLKAHTTKNSQSCFSKQDSNLGYERFIPSRKNSKMFINFQSKESSDNNILFKKPSKNDQTINNSSQQSSLNNANNNDSNVSIASLYQKHILETSENQKILSFVGNKQSSFSSTLSNSQPSIYPGSFTPKNGLYSQQTVMEQENICDEEYFKNPSGNHQSLGMKSKKKQQLVVTDSTKILDAPGLEDDYYLNLLHWSAQNIISIVLKNEVFGYNYGTRKIFSLQKPDKENTYKFTSVKFSKSGKLLAIGDSLGGVQVIDSETRREVAFFQNHEDRVASLSWINDDVLASGSKDCNIYCQDIRDKAIVRKYTGHRNEVCGLEWSCDQQTLASGGNDDKLFVWNIGYNQHQYKFSQHKAAVKAITWSPHQHGLLVSGGGSRDKTIRFWNIHTGKEIDCIETNSQVCSLAFTKNSNQFVSTHGYADNEIYVWKYPNPQKVKIFQGHQQRVIYMALSPDQKQIVTGASDETLRFWDAFPDTPSYNVPESTLKFSDLR